VVLPVAQPAGAQTGTVTTERAPDADGRPRRGAKRRRPHRAGASRVLVGGLSASAGVLLVTAMATSARASEATAPDAAAPAVPDATTTPPPVRHVVRIIVRRHTGAAPAAVAAPAPAPAAAPAPAPSPPPDTTTHASH
jgi:hypothetical protein